MSFRCVGQYALGIAICRTIDYFMNSFFNIGVIVLHIIASAALISYSTFNSFPIGQLFNPFGDCCS